MSDTSDDLMKIWLSLPDSIYPNTKEVIKDGKGQFDVNQPHLRGVAVQEDGTEVPFFCIRVEVLLLEAVPPQQGKGVMTFFRTPNGWRGTFVRGLQPSFDIAKSLPPLGSQMLSVILTGEVVMMPQKSFVQMV